MAQRSATSRSTSWGCLGARGARLRRSAILTGRNGGCRRCAARPPSWATNPAPSSYAIIAAQNEGGGDLAGLVHGFVRAVWAEERDVADEAVARDVLEAHGFDAGLVDSGMLAGAEEYAANLEEAVEKGVFGAPFYITDSDERFWGQDKIEDLDLYLQGKL